MRIVPAVGSCIATLTLATIVAAQQPGGRGGGRGTAIPAGQECPAGQTEIRPNTCMAPEAPAPSILDYRPKSTLVAPAHVTMAAKFPVIDYHGHPQGRLGSVESIESMGRSLDSINVRLMVSADNTSGERLKTALANIAASPTMKNRVRMLTGISFQNVGPGWAQKAIAQL